MPFSTFCHSPAAVGSAARAVAWDLYCGIGPISLLLARQGYRVLGIEENPKAVRDAVENAKRNRLTNASFVSGRVENILPMLPTWAIAPSLIIANPARTGIASAARQTINGLACRILYLSCNIETLVRDLGDLTASGRRVRHVTAFDMFAQTDNLEWLIYLD